MVRLAVAGATGAVGREMLSILEERDLELETLVPLASPRSRGQSLSFNGEDLEVRVLSEFDFSGIDVVLFSAGSGVVKDHADRILEAGCVIVDNSSAFRYDPEVPLVVPEINPHALEDHDGLIANPNCSTTQMVMALAPVHRELGIRRIVVNTYQAASGAGQSARDELMDQTRRALDGEDVEAGEEFPHPIAFNAIPEIGPTLDDHDRYTKEEMKMVWETRKILEDDTIQVSPTAVRIPVANCHGEAVNVETVEPCSVDEVRSLMDEFDGVEVQDDPHASVYPTMLSADGRDPVYVGRIRRDPGLKHGFNAWVVADNLRKGAALNTVQIAEELVRRGLLTPEPV